MKYDSPTFVDVYGHPYVFMRLDGWVRRCTCKNDEKPCDTGKWDINLPLPTKLVVGPPAVSPAEPLRKKWHL